MLRTKCSELHYDIIKGFNISVLIQYIMNMHNNMTLSLVLIQMQTATYLIFRKITDSQVYFTVGTVSVFSAPACIFTLHSPDVTSSYAADDGSWCCTLEWRIWSDADVRTSDNCAYTVPSYKHGTVCFFANVLYLNCGFIGIREYGFGKWIPSGIRRRLQRNTSVAACAYLAYTILGRLMLYVKSSRYGRDFIPYSISKKFEIKPNIVIVSIIINYYKTERT